MLTRKLFSLPYYTAGNSSSSLSLSEQPSYNRVFMAAYRPGFLVKFWIVITIGVSCSQTTFSDCSLTGKLLIVYSILNTKLVTVSLLLLLVSVVHMPPWLSDSEVFIPRGSVIRMSCTDVVDGRRLYWLVFANEMESRFGDDDEFYRTLGLHQLPSVTSESGSKTTILLLINNTEINNITRIECRKGRDTLSTTNIKIVNGMIHTRSV